MDVSLTLIIVMAVLFAAGVVQMGVPYWLFTRGLRSVSPQEAAIITLIEPLLNPVWAFLLTPEKDTPTSPMLLGGGLILLALVWRYFPGRRRNPTAGPAESAPRGGRRECCWRRQSRGRGRQCR